MAVGRRPGPGVPGDHHPAPALRASTLRGLSASLAALSACLTALALIRPDAFGVPRSAVAVLGPLVVALQGAAAAAPWDRILTRPAGRWILRADVGLTLVGLLAASALAGEASAGLVMSMILLVVFSAAVLPLAEHLAASTVLVGGATVTWAAVGEPAPDIAVRALAMVATVVLSSVSNRIAHRALSREQEARRALVDTSRQLQQVAAAARRIHSPDPFEVIREISRTGARLGWDVASIEVLDGHRVLQAAVNGSVPTPDRLTTQATPLAAEVLRTGGPVMTADVDARPLPTPAGVEPGMRTTVALPIRDGGAIRGVLVVAARRTRALDPRLLQPLELLADVAGRALQIAEHLDQERATIERLHELARLKERFVTTVSHELRTPLSIVTGTAETLTARWDQVDDGLRRDLATRLLARSRELEGIIATLLRLARRQGGHHAPTDETCDITAVLRRVVDRRAAAAPGHRFQVEPTEPIGVLGSRSLLDQVVDALVVNVAQHTREGTTATLSVTRRADTVRISVQDDGPGMSAAVAAQVGDHFHPGSGAESDRQRLGLGLALSQEILQSLGSSLEVHTAPGAGTVMTFVLPAADLTPVRQRRDGRPPVWPGTATDTP